ncbi:hypothetical protein SEPCBS57363_006783 [Sporothrix epigloea]|uniref:CCHC-type domain-containing protein n=1 Tax=Sporothrix epigloea TaxID=1892477 RepID=A0ABP0E820_9PEZI
MDTRMMDDTERMHREERAAERRADRAERASEREEDRNDTAASLHQLEARLTASLTASMEAVMMRTLDQRGATTAEGATPGPGGAANTANKVLALGVRTGSGRQQLPVPEFFTGKREKYEAWKSDMLLKLDFDGHAIGSPSAQFAYIYSCLAPDPKLTVMPFFNALRGLETSPEMMFNKLDSLFIDPNAKANARRKLAQLRQGPNEPASKFIAKFEQMLNQTGLADQGDELLLMTLEAALNSVTKKAIAYTKPYPTTYEGLKSLVGEVGSRVEGLVGQVTNFSYQQPEPYGEPMDLRAGAAGLSPGAAAISAHREAAGPFKGTCYRCHKKGHMFKDCPVRAGQKSGRGDKNVRAARATAPPDVSDSDSDNSYVSLTENE